MADKQSEEEYTQFLAEMYSPEQLAVMIVSSESFMWLFSGSDNWTQTHINALRQGYDAYIKAGGKTWGKP